MAFSCWAATYYVDFGAANDGDGSTYTQAGGAGQPGAFKTLVGHLGSSGDVFWIRRSASSLVPAAVMNFNVDNVKYIGWPLSGDQYYSTRPAGAQASWDGDAATYATIDRQANTADTSFTASGGTLQEFHRIKFLKSACLTSSSAQACVNSSVACLFENCYFSLGAPNNTTASIVFNYTGASAVSTLTLTGCTFTAVAQAITTSIISLPGSNFNVYMLNCTEPTSNGSGVGLVHSAPGAARTQYFYAENCSFYGGASNGTYALQLNGYAANVARFHFYNCSFRSSADKAIFYTATVGDYPNLVLNNCSVTGGSGINIGPTAGAAFTNFNQGGTFIHLKSFVQDTSSTYGIADYFETGTVYVENASFHAGNTEDIYTTGGKILCRNISTLSTPEVLGGLSKNIYMLDYGGTKGAFKAYQNNLTITSDVTARTGGEAYSIKMAPQVAPDITNQIVGQVGLPGQETIYANVAAGANTITIYGAYKAWGATPPTQADLWFEGSYYAGASGATVTAFSTRDLTGTALTSDTSTWTGDTGLTVFKITKTITAGQASSVPIRVYLSKYVSSAYIYIDPKVVVS